MGYEDISHKIDGKVIHIESLRYRGHWLDSHHSGWVGLTKCPESEIYFREWARFKVKKIGKYVILESLRNPNHFMDAHHSKWVGMTSSEYPNDKDWALWEFKGKNGSLDECCLKSKKYGDYFDNYHSGWGALAGFGDDWSRVRVHAPIPVCEYKTVYSTTNQLSTPAQKKIKFTEGVTHSQTTTFEVSTSLSLELSAAFEGIGQTMGTSFKETLTRSVTNTEVHTREVDYEITIAPNTSVDFQQMQAAYGPFVVKTQDVRLVNKR